MRWSGGEAGFPHLPTRGPPRRGSRGRRAVPRGVRSVHGVQPARGDRAVVGLRPAPVGIAIDAPRVDTDAIPQPRPNTPGEDRRPPDRRLPRLAAGPDPLAADRPPRGRARRAGSFPPAPGYSVPPGRPPPR